MSISGLGSSLSQLMAETAVQNAETNRTIRKAGYAQSQASIGRRNAERESKNDVQAVQGWVGVAQSAVSTVQTAVKSGQQIGSELEGMDVKGELSTEMSEAQTSGQLSDLQDVQLGEDGLTVGERFGEDQTAQLMRSDLGFQEGETAEQWNTRVGADLEEAGFSEGEVAQIRELAKDGEVEVEEVADFMWDMRQPAEEREAQEAKDFTLSELIGKAGEWFSYGTNEMVKDNEETAESMDEVSEAMKGIAGKAQEQEVDFNRAIGELSLRSLRERMGQSTLDR